MLQLHVNFRQTRWRSPHPTQCPLSPESRSGGGGQTTAQLPASHCVASGGTTPRWKGMSMNQSPSVHALPRQPDPTQGASCGRPPGGAPACPVPPPHLLAGGATARSLTFGMHMRAQINPEAVEGTSGS